MLGLSRLSTNVVEAARSIGVSESSAPPNLESKSANQPNARLKTCSSILIIAQVGNRYKAPRVPRQCFRCCGIGRCH
eukprot:2742182-Pyramimonas_sp.AAC.1